MRTSCAYPPNFYQVRCSCQNTKDITSILCSTHPNFASILNEALSTISGVIFYFILVINMLIFLCLTNYGDVFILVSINNNCSNILRRFMKKDLLISVGISLSQIAHKPLKTFVNIPYPYSPKKWISSIDMLFSLTDLSFLFLSSILLEL